MSSRFEKYNSSNWERSFCYELALYSHSYTFGNVQIGTWFIFKVFAYVFWKIPFVKFIDFESGLLKQLLLCKPD